MELKAKYSGVIVPMVSPLNDNYSIDEIAVNRIVDSFVKSEIKPFVIGTTGEGASLSAVQKLDLVIATVKATNGQQPVLAGISGNSLLTSVEEGEKYADYGVEAVVATAPNCYPMDDHQMLSC